MSTSFHPRIFSPVPPQSPAHERGMEDGLPSASPSAGAEDSDLAVARLAAIVESSDEAIISRTLDGIITTWNQGATRLYGYSEEEALGRCCLDLLLPPELRAEEEDALARVARGERISPFQTRRRHKSGVAVEVSMSVSPITDAAGAVVAASSISHDITESKQAELVRMRLVAIVDASADAIISKDLDRIVTSWNPAAERIFGYSAGEMIGHLCVRVVPPEFAAEELEIFARIRAGERVEAFDTVRVTREGRRIDVSISVAPIKDAAGHVVGAAKVIRDITERKQTEALRRAKEEAERANLAKSEFLSRMSHELRTPMNAILGFGQLLEFDALAPKQEESVTHILRAGRHLLSLVDEVLDLAHVESGRLEVTLETVRLGDVVLETLALMNPLAAKRKVTLRVDAHPGQPLPAGAAGSWPRVIADRRRLQQVLFNLLGNAIKYNVAGGQVTVDHVPVVGTDQLRLRVADTGPGISPEQRGRLFTPFERLGAEHGEVAGNGLGLSVAKALMEAMGGELGVEDGPANAPGPGAPGPGAVFWITMPLAEP